MCIIKEIGACEDVKELWRISPAGIDDGISKKARSDEIVQYPYR
jgi:hypothetical protein